MNVVEQRQLRDDASGVGEQEVRNHRNERRPAQVRRNCRREITLDAGFIRRRPGLIQIEAVKDVRLADARTLGGHLAELLAKRDEPELVLKEDSGKTHGSHRPGAIAAAIGVPAAPHRVDIDASATATMVAVLGCSNSRVIIGLKLLSDDCAQ